jgi:hypothetical protein
MRDFVPSRARSAAELAVFLVLGAAWVAWSSDAGGPGPTQSHVAAAAAALYAVFNAGRYRGVTEWWGLSLGGAVGAIAACAVVTLAAGELLRWIGAGMRVVGELPRYALDPVSYFCWCLVQDFLLCCVCAAHLDDLIPSRLLAAMIAGALFGLAHLPEASLIVLTFAGGAIWSWLFLRTRCLWPIVVMHWALGLALLRA